ncbi:MAG: sigma-E factor negative regulatory protein [Granulosicoccus sp.]
MDNFDELSDKQKMSQLMDGEWHDLNPSDCVARLCGDESLRAKWERYHLIRDAMNSEPVTHDSALTSRIFEAIEAEPAYSNITPFVTASGDQASTGAVQNGESLQKGLDEQSVDSATGAPEAQEQGCATSAGSLFNTGVTGFALAASVALITVVGSNIYQHSGVAPKSTAAVTAVETQQSGEAFSGNVQAVAAASSAIDGANAFAQQVDGRPLPAVNLVSNPGMFWMSPDSSARVENDRRLNLLLSNHLDNSPTASREGLLPYSRLVGYENNSQGR